MRTKCKVTRILAAFLSVILILGGIPMTAAASGTDGGRWATQSDAEQETDDELEEEDEVPIMEATSGDATMIPETSIKPMILDIPPIINSARIIDTEVSVPGDITLEIDVVEEGTGISYILLIGDRDLLALETFSQPLFTGTHIVDLELSKWLEVGEYEIEMMIVQDSNLATWYFSFDKEDLPFPDGAVFNVISSVPSRAPFTLESISLKNTQLQYSDNLKADVTINNIGRGINKITMLFESEERGRVYSAFYNETASGEIKEGRNTITINTSYFEEGSYGLVGIILEGPEGSVTYYKDDDRMPWLFGDWEITVTGTGNLYDPGPQITGARIKNTTVQAPGTIDIEMDITAGNGGIDYISINLHAPGQNVMGVLTEVSLPAAPGDLGEIINPDHSSVQTGTYTLRFPIPSEMAPGVDFYINEVVIQDCAGFYDIYDRYGNNWINGLPSVRILRTDYALETSVLHPQLTEMLKALPEGEKVLLDGNTSDIIPEGVFTALAGRNITVSVERHDPLSGLDGLYTFNGRDIKKSNIRNVPIKFSLAHAAGSDYDISDDIVYLLQFMGTGSLPCPMSFQLAMSSLLLPEDSYNSHAMYVSRVSGTTVSRGMTVSESVNGYIEIDLNSYSDFILSRTEPVYKSVTRGSGGSSSTADTGTWVKDESGWWYQYKDGTYPKATWQYLKGSWYYFEDNGYMATGWKYLKDKWYWLDPGTGKMAADSWINDRGNWYYMNADGTAATGWHYSQGSYYFLSETNDGYGRMLKDEMTPDGYYVNQDGVWVP